MRKKLLFDIQIHFSYSHLLAMYDKSPWRHTIKPFVDVRPWLTMRAEMNPAYLNSQHAQ